ncbi:MAG: hypothetical protein H6700_12745 [Myxococcales bacterium]|nr:hypothetical protein [Myxococcales bacterium]MCB9532628.1 hypothetical protein [Myxococcales bacterium]
MTDRVVAEVESLYRRRLFEAAIETGRDAIDSLGETLGARRAAELHTWIGLSALELDQVETALTSLTVAHHWDPVDRHVSLALGRLLLRAERDVEAWDVLEGVFVHHGDDMKPAAVASLSALLAESYLRGGEPGAALSRLDAALRVAPTDARLRELRVTALEAAAELDVAIMARRRLLAAASDPERRAAIGRELVRALIECERRAEAIEVARGLSAELDAALTRRPSLLRLWDAQTGLLSEVGLWAEAHAAFGRMVDRLDPTSDENQAVLALLWRNMGDLSARQLDDPTRAATEYEQAERHRSRADEGAVYKPTGMHEEVQPVDELWHLVVQNPGDLTTVERYGHALVESGARVHGESVLRVVVALGGGNPNTRAALDATPRWVPRRFARPLTDELRNRFVRPRSRRAALDALFHIAYHVVGHIFAHELKDHALGARDELDASEDLPVVRVFTEVSADLGFSHPPRLYGNRRSLGIASAFLVDPSFIIGTDVLGAEDSPALRFQAAQLLTMSQPRFFLAGLLTTSQLLAVVRAIAGVDLPGADRCDPALVQRTREAGRAAMTAAWEAPLQDVIRRLDTGGPLPRIQEWAALVSAEAARTGLLVANDIDASLAMVARHGVLREPERLDARKVDLALYAVSPEYHRLSEEVGLDPTLVAD